MQNTKLNEHEYILPDKDNIRTAQHNINHYLCYYVRQK